MVTAQCKENDSLSPIEIEVLQNINKVTLALTSNMHLPDGLKVTFFE